VFGAIYHTQQKSNEELAVSMTKDKCSSVDTPDDTVVVTDNGYTMVDFMGVHLVILCWLVPMMLLAMTLVCLSVPNTRLLSPGVVCFYLGVKILTDQVGLLPARHFHTLKVYFQRSFLHYFTMVRLTPSLTVSKDQWERPQVIMTGPHGVFNMGGIRSMITPLFEDKHVVCAIAPIMTYTWFEPILRLAGTEGMIALDHKSIQVEMSSGQRDIMVIPGGFVETNTGNEEFATMYDSKWEYWLWQCTKHGYDLSFQWIYGATQVYHTGVAAMATRLQLGQKGIPFTFPSGKFGTFAAYNDIKMAICGFRMPVVHVPDVDRSSPTFKALVSEFHLRVQDLLSKYPPTGKQSIVKMISSL
jgi:hypothetical protein